MSDRRPSRILQFTPGSILLTPSDARMLFQAAKLGELRSHYRIGDNAIYQLLTDISIAAFTGPAENGKVTRQDSATEERSRWTVSQVSAKAGIAPRTVRLDCSSGALPATKEAHAWVIPAAEAETYITRRRKN